MINFVPLFDDFKADQFDNLAANNVANLNSNTVRNLLQSKFTLGASSKKITCFTKIYKNGEAEYYYNLPAIVMPNASLEGFMSFYQGNLEQGLVALYNGETPDRVTIIVDIIIEED